MFLFYLSPYETAYCKKVVNYKKNNYRYFLSFIYGNSTINHCIVPYSPRIYVLINQINGKDLTNHIWV